VIGTATLVADRAPGMPRTRLRTVKATPPVAFREAAGCVYLVGAAAFPAGQDRLDLCVAVEAGASLRVRGTAASVAYAASGPGTTLEVEARVGAGAHLDWHLPPLIGTARCQHASRVRIDLDPTATLDWTEELLLGRHEETAGRLDLRLDLCVGGRPRLRHQLVVGSDLPGWAGPAVLDGARAAVLRLVVGAAGPPPGGRSGAGSDGGWATGPDPAASGAGVAGWDPVIRSGTLELDGGGVLRVALGADLAPLRAEVGR
jgi:urease accessory protein